MTQEFIGRPFALDMGETYIKALEELATPFPSVKFPDWQFWNKITGGFRTKEFTILCGATGCGKTTFLAEMSVQLLKAKQKHFVLSVETGATDYMKRILSSLANEDLNSGESVPVNKLTSIHINNQQIISSNLIEFSLYENRVPVSTLVEEIKFMVNEGCSIVFIDNLNFFMEVTRAADAIVEMDRVIHELIILCKQINVHIVMVMHPKKTEHGRVESEFDIKGSSTAVQEAHNVFLFNRLKASDIQNGASPFMRELKIAKMRRRGAFVGKSLLFAPESVRYIEKGLAN